jgi:hypothetical protein
MKYSLCFAASLLLLAGCQNDRPTAAQEEIIRHLDAIGTSIDKLGESLEKSRKTEPTGAVRRLGGAFEADPAKLAAIPPLPDKPTDEQIKSYLAAIADASAGQNSFGPGNPQVAMYRKIGPGHLSLLLPEMSGEPRNYHMIYALPALVGPADKKTALAALAGQPELLVPILKNGWGKEIKKEMFAVMAGSRSFSIQNQKKEIIELVENDEDRKQLIQAFIVQPNLFFLYDDLAKMPGVNATDLINQAWESQRFNSQNWTLQPLALQAARRGNLEAFGYLINKFCTRTPNDYFNDDILIFLALATGQPLQAEKLQNWYSENRDKLMFDPATKHYQVKK